MNRNDGGPAFPGQWYDFQPHTGNQVVREQWDGMTLRDYFAAKAMPAVLYEVMREMEQGRFEENWREGVADDAYRLADAMLARRDA